MSKSRNQKYFASRYSDRRDVSDVESVYSFDISDVKVSTTLDDLNQKIIDGTATKAERKAVFEPYAYVDTHHPGGSWKGGGSRILQTWQGSADTQHYYQGQFE